MHEGIASLRRKVSIHAPAWGATNVHGLAMVALTVSIHAPAWGATRTWGWQIVNHEVSIHAPAWGATISTLLQCVKRKFQSTRPRGARRESPLRSPRLLGFNPRARVGRDGRGGLPGKGPSLVSIHAPAWGATGFSGKFRVGWRVSIHAPAWGATRREGCQSRS